MFEAAPDLIRILKQEKEDNEKKKATFGTKINDLQSEIDDMVDRLEKREIYLAD